MKPLQLLFACLLFPGILLFSQDTKKSFDFFSSKNSYKLGETGYYGHVTNSYNGQSAGHTNMTYIDADWNHWFKGGLGAGIAVDGNWNGRHYNDTISDLTRTWSVSPGLSYGKTLTDRWGVYGRANLSFGIDNTIHHYSTTITNTEKSNTFGYGAAVAFPYRFSKYTAITTQLSYNYSQDKTNASKEKRNEFGFGIFMEDYLACNQMKCDPHTGFKLSVGKYDQGSGFIGGETEGSFNFGNTKFTYNPVPVTSKNKFNNAGINVEGSYYLLNYIAIGGSFGYSYSLLKDDDNNGFKTTSRALWFKPELTINAPVNNGWRNLFIKGGGDFGFLKTKINTLGTNAVINYDISGFNAGAGYYAFFAEETALKTCIYYQSSTEHNKNSNAKYKSNGFGISVGLYHSF